MKIIPKIGIGELVFGTNKDKVIATIGQPDDMIIDPDDANKLILIYHDLKMKLTISKSDNNRLIYIRSSNPKLNYNGLPIIDSKLEQVQDKVFGELIFNWEIDNYELFKTYFNEKNWIVLEVDYGRVTQFEMGVTFRNEYEYAWPEK